MKLRQIYEIGDWLCLFVQEWKCCFYELRLRIRIRNDIIGQSIEIENDLVFQRYGLMGITFWYYEFNTTQLSCHTSQRIRICLKRNQHISIKAFDALNQFGNRQFWIDLKTLKGYISIFKLWKIKRLVIIWSSLYLIIFLLEETSKTYKLSLRTSRTKRVDK